MIRYTDEQAEYITSIVPGRSYKEIADMTNEHFGTTFTERHMSSFVGNRKLNTGRTGRFEKGHIPANKGTKGLHQGGEATQFKKGHTPLNYRPVGSERINVYGYTEIKIADPNKWRPKHVVVWETVNGKVPKNHALLFGDGNKQNLSLDNIILVSRAQLAVINHNSLIANDMELTKTGILIANVIMRRTERKKLNKRKRKQL